MMVLMLRLSERPQHVGIGETQCAQNVEADDLRVAPLPLLWAQSCQKTKYRPNLIAQTGASKLQTLSFGEL